MIRTVVFLMLLQSTAPLQTPSTLADPRIALVTGSTDGIGKHTAKCLLNEGYKVLIHGRNQRKVDDTIKELSEQGNCVGVVADLSTKLGCDSLCEAVLEKTDRLDVLINNAGVFQQERNITNDGLELTFTVNVLAPFIITNKLLPLLRASADARITIVSSISMQDGPANIDFDNLQFENGGFTSYNSYGISKRLVAMFSKELSRRIPSDEALVISCDPGTVNTKMLKAGWGTLCGVELERADNEFLLSTMKAKDEYHGNYFVGCRKTAPHPDVEDEENGKRLWDILERMMNVHVFWSE